VKNDVLNSALAAVRAAGDEDANEIAAATRVRLRRSLEGHAYRRHRALRIGAVLAVLLVTSVSWALTTGRLQQLFAPAEPPPPPVIAPIVSTVPPPAPKPKPQQLAVVPEPVQPVPDVVAPAPPPPVAKQPVRARPAPTAPTPIEVLYRKAHDLHFHGGDHAAVLAAWDAYLAAEPTGRFAVEGRYNRALVLARLGRYAEARDALAPYARGEVAGGYRKSEAALLVERLAKIVVNDPAPRGD
jgi:hypothetical protein